MLSTIKKKQRTLFISLFATAVVIHISFYIPAHWTNSLGKLFIHVTKGQDFFQVPNGAYAFLRGGTLVGHMPSGESRYTDCCGINDNVYHPIFTLLVGTPLQMLKPWNAFNLWVFFHAVITLFTVLFILKKFRNHPFVLFALSIFLLNSYHYYEIQHAQYHFLFNFFTFLFLYRLSVHKDTFLAGVWLLLSLLVKPIGLLWIMPLLIYKRWKTILMGWGGIFY